MFGRKKNKNQVDMEDFQYVVIDTETTGLKPDSSRIIEIAVIQIDARGGRQNVFHTLLDPEKKFSNSEIHGIAPSMVKGAPKFSDAAAHIAHLLKDRIIVGHNIEFDLSMLSFEYQRLGVGMPSVPRIDTMKMCFDLDLETKNQQLSTLLEYFQLPSGMAHSALHDAAATSALFASMLPLYAMRHAGMRALSGQLGFEKMTWMNEPEGDIPFVAFEREGVNLDSLTNFPEIANDDVIDAQTRSKSDAFRSMVANPMCPQCGKGKVVVKNRRDGGQFRGCSNFPNCRYATDL